MSKNDGGPAFAQVRPEYHMHKLTDVHVSGGMTLRDYIATHAMAAIYAQGLDAKSVARVHMPALMEAVAEAAYEQADAMLKARES